MHVARLGVAVGFAANGVGLKPKVDAQFVLRAHLLEGGRQVAELIGWRGVVAGASA